MKKEIILSIKPEYIHNSEAIKTFAAQECGISNDEISAITIQKRSLDARGKKLHYTLQTTVYIGENPPDIPILKKQLQIASPHRKVLIIGAGPCGYFAALELLRHGIKPIILERGKDARARRRDLRAIQQFGIVNPHSNYCFGEGGAGTYSDGKLYTGSKKRGDIRIVLQLLVEHGAPTDILVDAHPHIGSNKLPIVVQNIRQTICEYGGEVHFDSYVTDIHCAETFVRLTTENGKEFIGDDCIIATGHSARDIFYLLHAKNIAIEPKPFALGVRAEHPQDLIDEIQYHGYKRGEYLPASSYKLVTHVRERGVFSFCMCPGGLIVPAATAPEEIVVNGMSMSRRDSAYANSGIICAVSPEHASEHVESGVFSCLDYQKH
ncbi:MAG TPA: FAD-dependent monooxygenase, partial [Candidatus Kapabacteria bacterium]|nr:FAD-dependent monooxygenase [Candidatus Kapabacteria bacterium]